MDNWITGNNSIVNTLTDNEKLQMYVLTCINNQKRVDLTKEVHTNCRVMSREEIMNKQVISYRRILNTRAKFKGFIQNDETFELMFEDVIDKLVGHKLCAYTVNKDIIMDFFKLNSRLKAEMSLIKVGNRENLKKVCRQYCIKQKTYMQHHYNRLVQDVNYFKKSGMTLDEYNNEVDRDIETTKTMQNFFNQSANNEEFASPTTIHPDVNLQVDLPSDKVQRFKDLRAEQVIRLQAERALFEHELMESVQKGLENNTEYMKIIKSLNEEVKYVYVKDNPLVDNYSEINIEPKNKPIVKPTVESDDDWGNAWEDDEDNEDLTDEDIREMMEMLQTNPEVIAKINNSK